MAGSTGVLIGISGKIASGKDTTALLLADMLGGTTDLIPNSKALKEEVTLFVGLIKTSRDYYEAVLSVMRHANLRGNVSLNEVSCLVDNIFPLVKSGEITNGYSRHPLMRKTLQYWGSDVRRVHDTDYWVKRTLETVNPLLNKGVNVIVPDVRFPNEVKMVHEAGGIMVRLDVSEEVQVQRVLGRDSTTLNQNAFTHHSETMLDDYTGFDVRISTDDYTPDEVAHMVYKSQREKLMHNNALHNSN